MIQYIVLQGNLTNRKFQSGKQAKKLAEKYQIQKAYQRSLQEQQSNRSMESQTNLQEEEETEKEVRPTLMEEHLSKRAKTSHSDSLPRHHQHRQERRPFDREKDIVAGKKLNLQEVQHLVQNAKELNSRFDKSEVQRTFL